VGELQLKQVSSPGRIGYCVWACLYAVIDNTYLNKATESIALLLKLKATPESELFPKLVLCELGP
jgi:hypothetical protein